MFFFSSKRFYSWVIVRADLIGTIFTVSLAIYLTYFTELNASNIGFSLNMSSEQLSMFLWRILLTGIHQSHSAPRCSNLCGR